MMSFEIESKQQVLDMLAPELTPDEAGRYLPMAEAEFKERTRELEKARTESARLKAICDGNKETARFLASKSAAPSAERDELKAASRNELFAMHGDCDAEGVSGMLRKKSDALNFVDESYSFMVEVKAPADQIVYLGALANEAEADHSEICAAAVLSRTRTIVALGPVMQSEGGQIGVIGGATERLREQAKVAYKRIESARNAAREARLAYERVQSARVSKGIVTSANTAHVFGH
jgi:hypothetical protein